MEETEEVKYFDQDWSSLVKAGKSKQQLQKFDYFAILDFEATCDTEKKLKPEIIEFPIVLLETKSLTIKSIFHEYVLPTQNPKLTEFCTQLTGIQQEWVDKSLTLDKVLLNVDKWMNEQKLFEKGVNFAFATCGDWDLGVMLPSQTTRESLKVKNYFSSWINVKHVFRDYYKIPKSMGMDGMLKLSEMTLDGHHHSGIGFNN
jgi:ERI1 exoribonuclease 3